jgi:hypothetical protein
MNFDYDDIDFDEGLHTKIILELLDTLNYWYDPPYFSRRFLVAVLEDVLETFESPRKERIFWNKRNKWKAKQPESRRSLFELVPPTTDKS